MYFCDLWIFTSHKKELKTILFPQQRREPGENSAVVQTGYPIKLPERTISLI